MSVPTPPPPPTTGSDPDRPGSRAWVEQRYGRTAAFADRIVPGIIDGLLSTASATTVVVDRDGVYRGTIGIDELVAAGAVRKNRVVKVLGDGEISVKVDVTATKVTGAAKAKIEAAGGSVTAVTAK